MFDLFHPGEMVGIVFIPLALVTASFGFSGLRVCAGLFSRITQSKSLTEEKRLIYEYWIRSTYVVSFLMFLAAIVVSSQFLSSGLALFGEKIGEALSAFFYAIVIGEFFIRPTLAIHKSPDA